MANVIPFSPSRLDSHRFLIKECRRILRSSKKIIDIGCGKLYFLDVLIELDVRGNYLGIDLDPRFIKSSSKYIKTKIVKADFQKYKINGKFDLAVCLWVLEHIKNDGRAVAKISNVLKKNGLLMLAVPSVWTWPFEFGRHGYHYYSKHELVSMVEKAGFKLVKFHQSAGFLGFLFMIIYNWPRYLLITLGWPIYKLLRKKSWTKFSANLVNNSLYRYHRYEKGIEIHNKIVQKIVEFDNKFKIAPASYILILQKK